MSLDTYKLVDPIQDLGGGGPITEVNLRFKPRVEHLRKVAQQRDEIAQNAMGLECITDLPPKAIDKLGVVDFQALSKNWIEPLFSGKPASLFGSDASTAGA